VSCTGKSVSQILVFAAERATMVIRSSIQSEDPVRAVNLGIVAMVDFVCLVLSVAVWGRAGA
jgi:hypothetical protein